MKTKVFLVVFAATALIAASELVAQTPATTGDTAAAAQLVAPDQVIYAPRLPTVQELTDAAAARGATIERVEETAAQMTATYRQADGRTSTVAYALLPSASPGAVSTYVTTPPPPVVISRPTVIYRPSRRVVYYDPWIYDPWYPYPSLSFGLGFGLGHYRGHTHVHHHHRHGGRYRGHR